MFIALFFSKKPWPYNEEGRRLLSQMDLRWRRVTLEEYLTHTYAGGVACYMADREAYSAVVLYEDLVRRI